MGLPSPTATQAPVRLRLSVLEFLAAVVVARSTVSNEQHLYTPTLRS